MTNTNELVSLEAITAENLFSEKGKEWVLGQINERIKGFVPDISTDKGRKEIASIAYKVSQSKTAIDKKRLDVVSEWKKKAKEIDAGGKLIRDALDAKRDEIRKPLTDFENAEKQRISEREGRISDIVSLRNVSIATLEQAQAYAQDLQKISDDFDFMEFKDRADREVQATQAYINSNIERITEIARQKAELEALEKKRAEEAQKAREEALIREAEERAKREAKAERDAILKAEEEKRQAEFAKIQEAQRLEQAKKDAEEKAKRDDEIAAQAERDRQEQERLNAERKLREEAEQKLREAEAKRKAEEAEAQRIAQEAAQREANLAHKKSVNNEACEGLLALGLSEEQAKSVVISIAQGKIKNVKIEY